MKGSRLGAFLVLCVFLKITTILCSTSSICGFEPLPKSFNTLGYLDFNQEFHIHGEYLVDFTKFSQTITFNLTTKSSCRFTLAPQEMDIDLWLYSDKGTPMHSSLAVGTEEVIFADLDTGGYRLRFVYLAIGSGIRAQECPTVLFEAAIVPVDRLTSRIQKFSCPSKSDLPPESVGNQITAALASPDGEFEGASPYVWIPTSGTQNINWIGSVTFTIPSHSANSLYSLEATIGYDFITGSSLGLMIQTGDHPSQLTPVQCSTAKGCWVGSNYRYNQHVLMTNLPPGNYTVWLFEVTAERSNHITCLPFSLSLEIAPTPADENLLNCPNLPPPLSLNSPGFIDHAGNLFFLQDVLISSNLDVLAFQVSVPSALRIFVSHAKFDVDLYLANASLAVIDSAIRYGDDGLTARVEPGKEYNIAISMGGYHPDAFCETYRLEIALAPLTDASLYSSKCPAQDKLPDLSALTTGNNIPFELSSQGGYAFLNHGNPLPREGGIYNITFSVNQTVIFYAELEFNFLWGDMSMTLQSPSLNPDYFGSETHGNRVEMGALLSNGTYTFSINLAPVQPGATTFTSCDLFDLELIVIKDWEMPECSYSLAHELPTSLDTVEYFGTSNRVHFQDDFFLPDFSSRYAEQEMTFTPPVDSYLRIFLEVYSFTIEVYLYNHTSLISQHSAQTFGKMFEKVKQGERYTLVFRYFQPDFDTTCLSYNLELAIEPVSANQPECTQATDLPTVDQLPMNGGNFSKTYYYDQTDSILNYSIPLNITKEKVIAVLLNFNFLLYDLYLELTDSTGQAIGYGVNGYNSNLLGPVILPIGSYTLKIAETVRAPEEIQGCIAFLFTVEIQDHKTTYTEEELALECKVGRLPPQLNLPGYLSNISGQILHFAQPILINPGVADYSFFEVYEDTLFRVHIPAIPMIDVDFSLWDSNNTQIDYRISTGEETMWLELSQGQYSLEFRYYAGQASQDNCVSFPLQLAIEPLSYVKTLDKVTTACTTSVDIPSQLQGNVSFHGEYQFTFAGAQGGFSRSLIFQISQPGHLDIDVGFDFATGGLSARLSGLSNTNVSYQWTGIVGVNHIFIGENLQVGNYTLTVYTPSINTPPVNSIKCGQFSLDYFLNVTSSQGSTCNSVAFPTDLYSPSGGSQPYGGPQDPVDSSIRLFSKQFEVPTVQRASYFLAFQVKVPCYLRFFSYSPTADIDFYIYKDVNRSVVIGSSLSFDTTESRLFSLPAQTNEYLFELRFVSVPTTSCNLFHFEMAIEPTSTVNNEILCPNPLPVPELPPDNITVPAGLFEFGSTEYILSKEKIGNNTYSYDYEIYLQIDNVPADFYAEVAYDFIPNSFQLFLYPPATGGTSEVFQGTFDGTEDRSADFNFINYIDIQITRPGLYLLYLSEDLWSQRSIFNSLENYCHHFGFSLAVTSKPQNSTSPHVLRISPSEGTNLDPSQELRIMIFFSTSAASPSLTEISNVTGNYAYLSDLSNNMRISPSSVRYGYLNQSLVIVYAPNSLSLSKSYRLVFYPEKFKDSLGNVFTMNDTSEHIYIMQNCDCNGHGTCVASSGRIACACSPGYTGTLCQACAPGYHGLGTECVANMNCTPSYCNGHGNCSQIQGVPHCDCDEGWATTGDAYCTACAYGYIFKDDQCVAEDDGESKPTHCTAPLFPKSLNTPAYLNYNQSVELSGFYYIDVKHRRDDIDFELTQDSLIRIYVEPHLVDIDLWLGIVDSTGRVLNINHQLSLGGEESIFMYLEGSSLKPMQYRFTMRYYIWGAITVSDCETANFQLSISPVASVALDQVSIQKTCTQSGNLPNLEQNKTIGSPFVYKSPSVHSRLSSCPVSTESGTTDPCQTDLYFYSWNFTLDKVENKVPVILASIEYHFLPADFGLVLEIGQGMQCSKKFNSSICFFGQNEYNKNELKMDLQPGLYTLHVYQPKPQMSNVTTCGAFSLSVSIVYVTIQEDFWDCSAGELPETFNSPGYLDNSGFMHRQDSYFLGKTVDVDFTLTTQSIFRVSTFSSNIFFIWALSNETYVFYFRYSVNQKDSYTKNSMFAILAPGHYNLTIIPQLDSQSVDGRVFCPTALIEMAVQPVGFKRSCPSNNRDILPALPETIRTPFLYRNDSLLLFMNNKQTRQFASYNIVVDQLSSLKAIITDDFVEGDLTLELFTSANLRLSTGITRYNENAFYTLLQPGNYSLRLSRSSDWNSALSSCLPFSFYLELNQTVSENLCYDQIENALSTYPETLPTTLDTTRFLKSSNKIHFAGSFWIPSMDYYVIKNITLTPAVPSLFRIFLEPHEIDIDVKLSTLEGQTVATGSNGWNTEEELIEDLEAQTYVLTIVYYNWYSAPLNCLAHDIEFAIAPLDSIQMESLCPQGKDHWPTAIPQSPSLPFIYDSIASKETLYYQQTTTSTKRKDYIIVLSKPTDLYASLSFDFLTSHLALQLSQEGAVGIPEFANLYTSSQTYLDRSVLAVRGLLPGTYNLSIVELYPSEEEVTGCAYFSMYLELQDYGSDQGIETSILDPALPPTLDSLSYLQYSDRLHIQGPYTAFHGTHRETVQFTVAVDSVARVYVDNPFVTDPDVKYVLTILSSNPQYYSAPGTIIHTLSPGSWNIYFQLVYDNGWTGDLDKDVILNTEIAIAPLETLQKDIASWPRTCTVSKLDDIQLNPQGYYQESRTLTGVADVSSNSNILQQVKFTLEQETLLFVSIGYNFLLYDIDLVLQNDAATVKVFGTTRRNSEDLDVLLKAGTYTLTLTYQASNTFSSLGKFCFDYTYDIQIQPSTGTHSNCLQNDLVPWDLNTPSGGSAPFGGPVNPYGQLILAGTSFALVDGKLIDYINVTVQKNSVISVFTSVNSGSSYLGISTTLNTVPPVYSQTTRLEGWKVFQLNATTTPQKYTISLDRLISTDRQSCPSFAMSIALDTLDSIERQILCPQSIYSRLPSSPVSIVNGIASEHIESILPNGYSFPNISFELTESALFFASMEFNPFVHDIEMELYHFDAAGSSIRVRTGEMKQVEDDSLTSSTHLSFTIAQVSLTKGNYTLVINSRNFVKQLFGDNWQTTPFQNREVCYPFVWDLLILPIFRIPYVMEVDPEDATDIFFGTQTVWDISIRFSTQPYTRDSLPITASSGNAVKQAFYLSGGGSPLYPDFVTADEDGMDWKMSWYVNRFRAGVTYTLKLVPTRIYNASQYEFTLPGIHTYSTADTSCNGHGTFKDGACLCNAGYVGKECDICDLGYQSQTTTEGISAHCVPVGSSELCQPDSCGCLPVDGNSCEMIGLCDDSSGKVVCSCPPQYAGAHCEKCAAGYIGYPRCVFSDHCPTSCGHGECKVSTGSCACFTGWAGTHCDTCAPGFSGSDCSIYDPDEDTSSDSGWDSTLRVMVIIGVVLLVVVILGFAAYFIWKRRTTSPYHRVNRNLFDDEELAEAHTLDDFSSNNN